MPWTPYPGAKVWINHDELSSPAVEQENSTPPRVSDPTAAVAVPPSMQYTPGASPFGETVADL